jgi:hypothetical protein
MSVIKGWFPHGRNVIDICRKTDIINFPVDSSGKTAYIEGGHINVFHAMPCRRAFYNLVRGKHGSDDR